ncbi:DASH complex subunit DAD4 [Microsporum canis CBS 113480]|uniref:DASH complex subunit DAD4 n=1 Tax=Arthroderma otae (strain ATCC MYA-4605 / CBS 113480) TaxID=554155 RepID=C5FGJ3_ARTOC|nr:DASH complex subunit DAD4 [Microsporum canis CBS 113480]EEQ29878.1 DASH complex subunit DAD4 [Microsporum canis CBS 113480]
MLSEKLNEAITVLNKGLQEVNVQNMNVELVVQMFKNYQSNVLFHLEGLSLFSFRLIFPANQLTLGAATENLKEPS